MLEVFITWEWQKEKHIYNGLQHLIGTTDVYFSKARHMVCIMIPYHISHVFGNTYTTFQPFPTRTFNVVRYREETGKVPYHHKHKHHKQYKIIGDDVAF